MSAINIDNVVINQDNIPINYTSDVEAIPDSTVSRLQVLMDISGLGDFSGPLDDVTNSVLNSREFSFSRGKNQIKQFAQGEAGRAEFTLKNITGDYDGLAADMKVCIKLRSGSIGAGFEFEDGDNFEFEDGESFEFEDSPIKVLWSGYVDNLIPEVNRFVPTVKVFCISMLGLLVDRTISTELIENETIDQIIDRILTRTGWSVTARVISPSAKTLPFYCLDNADPFQALSRLALTEGGHFYDDSNGNFVFEDGTYRATQPRSTISQADYTNAKLRARDPSLNLREVVDACIVEIEERAAGAKDKIWELGEDLILTSGQVKRLPVRGSDWFKNAAVPSPIGVNAEQFIIASQELFDGSAQLGYKGIYTTDLDWDVGADDVRDALEAVLETVLGAGLGVGSILVSGESFTLGFTIHFRKTLKEQEVELLTVRSSLNPTTKPATIKVVETRKGVPDDGSGLPPLPANEVQTLFPDSTLVSGQWTVNANTTPLSTTATAANLQSVLNAIFGVGNRLVAGGPVGTADMTVEAQGSDALSDVALLEIHSVPSNPLLTSEPTATLNISTTVKGGGADYTLAAGSIASMTINRPSGPSLMLTITAGPSGATIIGLQLRAQPYSVVRRHPVAWPEEAADSTWIDDFASANGRPPRIERPDIWSGMSRADALMFCMDFVNAYDSARETNEIDLSKAFTDSDFDMLFEREVSDRATLTPGDAFIERLNYSSNGVLVDAKFGLEQVAA